MNKKEWEDICRLAVSAGMSKDELTMLTRIMRVGHSRDLLNRAKRLLRQFCGDEKHDMGSASMDLLCGGDDVNKGVDLAHEIEKFLREG